MTVSLHLNSETELLKAIQSGDRKAFDKLFLYYAPIVYPFVLKMVRSETVAAELLQDTFVKVWDNRNLIDTRGSAKGWIFTIARNEVYMFFRKLSRDKRLQEHINQTFDESYSHIEERIIQAEEQKLLQAALDQLSPQRRQVFHLCKIEGKSYDEVASILQISPNTVSSHMVKASHSIRQYLKLSAQPAALLLIALLSQFK